MTIIFLCRGLELKREEIFYFCGEIFQGLLQIFPVATESDNFIQTICHCGTGKITVFPIQLCVQNNSLVLMAA